MSTYKSLGAAGGKALLGLIKALRDTETERVEHAKSQASKLAAQAQLRQILGG